MVEKIRVLVVDDSAFFRKRIRHELEQSDRIEVAGEAADGIEAVEMATRLKPDLITMDVAMPRMDGIAAVREILRARPTPIIMVSALTREGARATLEALDAGAVDFLPKQGCVNGEAAAGCRLSDRVIDIAQTGNKRPIAVPRERPAPPAAKRRKPQSRATIRLLAIGASTGGPVAIQRVLANLPANYPYPVLVAVHMPGEFSVSFAERLDTICPIEVKLAVDADPLLPGRVLIAPGGMQTLVETRAGRLRVRVEAGSNELYKPSIDLMFGSAAQSLEDAVHALILTGMGADGTEGARQLKQKGAVVWSQDRATSVVYGMPYSVVKAGMTDRVMPLDEIGPALSGLA